MEISIPEILKMRSWPSFQVLYSKQATCIADFFTPTLAAVSRILGLDVVRELTQAEWAIRTPGPRVKLSGYMLQDTSISPTALACSLPFVYLKKL